jgi:hypothetical protein
MEFKSENAGRPKEEYKTEFDRTMILRDLQHIKRTYNTYYDFLKYCEGKLITVSRNTSEEIQQNVNLMIFMH